MKKIILALILFSPVTLRAAMPAETGYIPFSSFTAASLPAPVMFSSHPIQFVAVNISSPAFSSKIIIYRSTSNAFTVDIASQVTINTGYSVIYGGNQTVPLFDMRNTSYTYIQKIGAAEVTIFFRCFGDLATWPCPGLTWSGQK